MIARMPSLPGSRKVDGARRLQLATNWIACALFVLGASALLAPTASAQAAGGSSSGTKSSGSTKTASNAGQVPMAKIKPLIGELDQLFVRGDVRSYLSKFVPDHQGSLAMLGRHLELLLKLTGKDRKRESSIVAGPMVFEDRTVVRIRHVTTWPGKTAGANGKTEPRKHIEDTYLAVRNGEQERIVPTFEIDMPPQIHCVTDAKLKCPPCNYEIGGVDGFLCVPLRRERGLALESASFYLIGTDVVCDVHVQVPARPQKAKAVALKLAEAFAKLEPSAQVGIPSAWLPPMHKKEPPEGMDAARLVVELPEDDQQAGGGVTIFHVVAFGGVQHVLLVRSTKASLQQHQKSVDQLFMSYMLLELDCEGAALATRPLRQHTGGILEGSTYRNERYDLSFSGPEGWKAQQRVGGSMFRIRWSGPNASHMWLVGHQVPAGMASWTRNTADRWLQHHTRKHDLGIDAEHAATDEAKWQERADGSLCRTAVLLEKRKGRPDSPRRRIVHLQLHKDLLLVVDGFGGTSAEEQALRAAIPTLKRK